MTEKHPNAGIRIDEIMVKSSERNEDTVKSLVTSFWNPKMLTTLLLHISCRSFFSFCTNFFKWKLWHIS